VHETPSAADEVSAPTVKPASNTAVNAEATSEHRNTQDHMGFNRFGLASELIKYLTVRGISNPTDVQVEAIPLVLRRQNLIVQAKTGTGKTFAFGLPLLNLLLREENSTTDHLTRTKTSQAPRALIVAPTRELAVQVHHDLEQLGKAVGLRATAVYGGADMNTQISNLRTGTDVVVGTPGRLLDLANQGVLELSSIDHVVLDEADEMLNMGFLPDVTKLLSKATNRSQTLLFSATMPVEIRQLARRFAPNPYFLHITDTSDESAAVARVTQYVYQTHPLDKPEILARLLQADRRGPTIVFCRTKRWAQRLSEEMNERGFDSVALHGDLSQNARERALQEFRSGMYSVLVATDVAARGIDINGITHVVNYDAPEDAATYLHRIGRTARAGRDGIAVSLIDIEFAARWTFIARDLGLDEKLVETFSTSPHLYDQLAIAPGTKGRLNTAAVPSKTSRPSRGSTRAAHGRHIEGPTSNRGQGERQSKRQGGERSTCERRRDDMPEAVKHGERPDTHRVLSSEGGTGTVNHDSTSKENRNNQSNKGEPTSARNGRRRVRHRGGNND
jgi:superfamily II DNA/RNA helicase